jgi:hypothetical protein
MKPQKHAKLIHLWADGAEIEVWDGGNHNSEGRWEESCLPDWFESCRYRVKPKPDVVMYHRIGLSTRIGTYILASGDGDVANVRLTFDNETGKLKDCEFIPEGTK